MINGSYWHGYLGYPAIAFLLTIEKLEYKKEYGKLLKGILWKEINQRFKNDFDKTLNHIFESVDPLLQVDFAVYVGELESALEKLKLEKTWKEKIPTKRILKQKALMQSIRAFCF